ncbi:MAG: hypothetical protein HY914_00330 [Desulfomonile tiedjei]|nr:hypothetical protein [Desulfomonile tiedjei]
MKKCTGQEISEKLAMALSPAEFPQEIDGLHDHIRDCSACQEELAALEQAHRFLSTYAVQLGSSMSGCPSSDTIVALARKELVDPTIESHVGSCPRCAQEVELIEELSRETCEGGDPELSLHEKKFIRNKIAEVYSAPAQGWGQRVKAAIQALRADLSLPSLALGAVAAALLMIVILPRSAEKEVLFPVFSDVVWHDGASRLMAKGPFPGGQPAAEKKIAVLIVVPEKSGFSQSQLDETYEKVDLAKRLGGSYEIVSPRDLRAALQHKVPPGEGLKAVADQAFSTLGVDYLLCFELHPSAEGVSLQGMLFQKGMEGTQATITQTKLALSRIPSRITAIAAQLLLDAEHS